MEDQAPKLTIDITEPVYTDFREKDSDDDLHPGGTCWYRNKDITFTYEIDDAGGDTPYAGISYADISINGHRLQRRSYEGETVRREKTAGSFHLNDEECREYSGPGKNRVVLEAVDAAGNKAVKTVYVCIDSAAPRVTGFSFYSPDSDSPEGKRADPVTAQNYGFFFSRDTVVRVYAEDENPSSGIRTVKFLKKAEDGTITVEEKKVDAGSDSSVRGKTAANASFTVKRNFKGQIYAWVDDHAGY